MGNRNARAASTAVASKRPTRDLLLLLPLLKVSSSNDIDYEAASPDVLVQIASNAETCQATVHLGISAIGQLLTQAAPEVELAEISGDAVEALGRLIAELGDLANVAQSIATACRRYTTDYAPARTGKASLARA